MPQFGGNGDGLIMGFNNVLGNGQTQPRSKHLLSMHPCPICTVKPLKYPCDVILCNANSIVLDHHIQAIGLINQLDVQFRLAF